MTVKASDILGMNARQLFFSNQNSSKAVAFASSKHATKILLENNNIPTATVHGVLLSFEDVQDFNWQELDSNFVIKPTNGNAGKGIVAFRKQHKDREHWTSTTGKVWSIEDVILHCYDILEGQYSTYGSQHHVIVEERIPIHPTLRKFAVKGTPDIRIIVFNSVPVMSFLRLPTEESEGRANLHQGAIAAGVDIATGITTHAITGKGESIFYLPKSKRKLNGIKIPFWNRILTTAIRTAQASGLYFSAIDLFVDEVKGPMVVEINANPGLSIQLANRAGLRKRLERVAGINVIDAGHGAKIGKALFAERFADKIKSEEGLTVISPKERVTLRKSKQQVEEVTALVNTGRFRSIIAHSLAEELDLLNPDDLLWFEKEDKDGSSPIVEVTFMLKGQKIKTAMIVSKKLNKTVHKIELGRNDLKNFLVGME